MNQRYDLLIRNANIIDGARPGRLLRAGAAAEHAADRRWGTLSPSSS